MKVHFATLMTNQFWKEEPFLLAKSLRTFGGELAAQPLTLLTPQGAFLPDTQTKFENLSLAVFEFPFPESAAKFPLALIPYAAAAAESHLANQCDVLVWLLPDTLILKPPTGFFLPEGKDLAYRPVHHQNVGSVFNQPPDDFWQQIYRHTDTPEARLFKMSTCYQEEIRPYFNAGILAVRPELGILQQWAEVFDRTYQHPDFTPFYQDQRYAVFMHQAILAGIILHHLDPERLSPLPESYNYPLHMHENYPPKGKANQLSDLVTARYENTRDLPGFLAPFEEKNQLLTLLS